MGNLDEYETVDGNVVNWLTMTNDNPLYVEYLENGKPERELETKQEEIYEWKCFLLHKYFKSQIVVSIMRVVIGLILFCFSFGYVDYLKRLPAGGAVVTLCFCAGIVYTLFGLSLIILYSRMSKHHRQYMWQEKTRLSERMRKYFMKNYF